MATNHIALLGAGFSHNWNAPLASEISNSLLVKIADDQDPYLRELLTLHGRNFEIALSEVQQEYVSSPSSSLWKARLDRLQNVIIEMFDELNAGLETKTDFNPSTDLRFSVREFLARFDAIFGLNQDLLLELQYKDSLPTASSRRWGGLQMPGMKRLPNQLSGFGDKHKRRWTSGEYEVEQRHQPYFKMHGSSNWYTHDGQNLLVMGGNKDLRMSQHDVLRRYYQEFENHLARKDTRLMVIGYSFSDKHVNDAIRKGVFKGIFLVDPVGWSLVDQHDELKGIPRLGGSTRHMWKTFAGDGFELEKISEFFR